MKNKTAMEHVIRGLVPFTDENIMLTYKPSKFFDELERIDRRNAEKHNYSQHSRSSLRMAYSRAKRRGLIAYDRRGFPYLTEKGSLELEKYEPKKLKGAKLLVIFDVEEKYRSSRDKFRNLLKALKFKQVQRSVWISEYDSRGILAYEIQKLNISKDVIVYEARTINT